MYLAGKAKVECTFLYAHKEEFLFYDQYNRATTAGKAPKA